MTPVLGTGTVILDGPYIGNTIGGMYQKEMYHELLAMLEANEWQCSVTDKQTFVKLMTDKIYEAMDIVVEDEMDYADTHD